MNKVSSAHAAELVVVGAEPVRPAQEVQASRPPQPVDAAQEKEKARAERLKNLEPNPAEAGKTATKAEPTLPAVEPHSADKTAQTEPPVVPPVVGQVADLPGDPAYPADLRLALAEVIGARKKGKSAIFEEIFGTGHVRNSAEKVKVPYLDVCQKYLIEEGAGAFSDSRITTLVQVFDYLVAKNFKSVGDLTSDLNCFPAYSQILPLYKFVRHPRIAQAHQAEWDELHSKVFDQRPANRPTVEDIEKAVGKIFAPPKKKHHNKNETPAVVQTVIKPEQLTEWYAEIAPKGKLAIAEITVAKMTASALATAMESDWKSVKSAQLLRIKVGTKEENK